jgi:hypothetical protein
MGKEYMRIGRIYESMKWIKVRRKGGEGFVLT